MIRIVLVEDHQLVRNGIRTLLEKEPDFKIVGEFGKAKEVLTALSEGLETDIVFIDMMMPDMDGVTLSGTLSQKYPEIKKVVLTMMDNEKYLVEAFQKGVMAYLLKNISPDEMLFAVRHVFKGEKYICSELSNKLFEKVSRYNDWSFINLSDVEFSEREMDLLRLTADGYTNAETAEKLSMSRRTVEGMRKGLIERTHTKNTAALIQFAFRNGLLK